MVIGLKQKPPAKNVFGGEYFLDRRLRMYGLDGIRLPLFCQFQQGVGIGHSSRQCQSLFRDILALRPG